MYNSSATIGLWFLLRPMSMFLLGEGAAPCKRWPPGKDSGDLVGTWRIRKPLPRVECRTVSSLPPLTHVQWMPGPGPGLWRSLEYRLDITIYAAETSDFSWLCK